MQRPKPQGSSSLARHLTQPIDLPELERRLVDRRHICPWPLFAQPVRTLCDPLHVDQVVSIAVHLGYCTSIQYRHGPIQSVLPLRLGEFRARCGAALRAKRLPHRLRRVRAVQGDVPSAGTSTAGGSESRKRRCYRREGLQEARSSSSTLLTELSTMRNLGRAAPGSSPVPEPRTPTKASALLECAHFNDRGRWFQRNRGRCFRVIVDDHGSTRVKGST